MKSAVTKHIGNVSEYVLLDLCAFYAARYGFSPDKIIAELPDGIRTKVEPTEEFRRTFDRAVNVAAARAEYSR